MVLRPIQLCWLAAVTVACLAGSVMGEDLHTDLLVKPVNCPLTCPNGTDNGIYCVQIGGTFEGDTSPMKARWVCDLMPAILGVADRPVTQRDPTYTIQCPDDSHLIYYGEMYETTAYACYNDSRSSNTSSLATVSSPAPVASPDPSTNSTMTPTPASSKESASPEVIPISAAMPGSTSLLANASDIVVIPANMSSQKTTPNSAGYARVASALALFAGVLAATFAL